MNPKLVLDEVDKQRRFSKYKNFKSNKTAEKVCIDKPDSYENKSESDSLTAESDDEDMDLGDNVILDKNNIFSDLHYHESILDPVTGLVRDVTTKDDNMIKNKVETPYSTLTKSESFNVIKTVRLQPSQQEFQLRKSVIVRNDVKEHKTIDKGQNAIIEIELESLEDNNSSDSDRQSSTFKICIDLGEIEDMYTAEENLYFTDLLNRFKQISKVSFGEELMNDYIHICKSVSHPILRMVPQTIKKLHQFLNIMENCNK